MVYIPQRHIFTQEKYDTGYMGDIDQLIVYIPRYIIKGYGQ